MKYELTTNHANRMKPQQETIKEDLRLNRLSEMKYQTNKFEPLESQIIAIQEQLKKYGTKNKNQMIVIHIQILQIIPNQLQSKMI